MATVTPAVERLTFPAGGLRLYRHQQETWDARRVHGFHRRITNDHRQSGKDVAALVDLLDQAMHEPGVYAYIGPTRQMVENIAWHGVRASDGGEYLSILPAPLLLDRNEADLSLEIATVVPGKHSRLLFLSGNEPARVRGLPLRGAAVTEYSQFESSEILDTILPALNRSGGDLLVLSTPLGVGNAYHRLFQMAQDSAEWWTATRTIADTVDHAGRPLIDPGLLDRELAQGQRPEWLDQEYRCQFVVGLVSSIFGDLLTQAEQEHRITDLPRAVDRPTVVAFDLGIDDATVCTWVQENGPWLDVVDVEAWQNLSLAGIIQRVQARGWLIREWLFPHDLGQRDLSAAGVGGQAERREEQVRRLGLRYTIAPKRSVSEGLDAVRRLFSKFRFDRLRAAKQVEALGQYQRAWDPERRVYAEKPKHDWASHYADSLRTFAMAYRVPIDPTPYQVTRYAATELIHERPNTGQRRAGEPRRAAGSVGDWP